MREVLEIGGKVYEHTRVVRERLGIGETSITRWIRRGLLPDPLVLGNTHYFRRDLVDDRIAKGE